METFGIYSYADLRRQDFKRREIDQLVATGQLRRLSRGWYARPDANLAVAEALKYRGRIGCVTGCGLHGVWVPQDSSLHVLAGGKRRPRLSTPMIWHPWVGAQPPTPLFPLEDCLEQVVHRHSVETALTCLESATQRRLIDETTARTIIATAPMKKLGALSYFDPRAESGTETRVRLFLQHRGVRVQSQVPVEGVGRADLIAGNNLLIECDSRRYHTAEEQYERDRARDLASRLGDYTTVRLSYAQVFDTWNDTQAMLSRLLKQRRHRGQRRPAA